MFFQHELLVVLINLLIQIFRNELFKLVQLNLNSIFFNFDIKQLLDLFHLLLVFSLQNSDRLFLDLLIDQNVGVLRIIHIPFHPAPIIIRIVTISSSKTFGINLRTIKIDDIRIIELQPLVIFSIDVAIIMSKFSLPDMHDHSFQLVLKIHLIIFFFLFL